MQMQFFVLCPLLMLCLAWGVRGKSLNRHLAKAAGTIVGAVTLYRAVIALDFRLPVPVFGPLDDQRALEHMTRTLQVSISISCVCSPPAQFCVGRNLQTGPGDAMTTQIACLGRQRFGTEGFPCV